MSTRNCAWCLEPPGSVYQCTKCFLCNKFIHGSDSGRVWATEEQIEKRDFINAVNYHLKEVDDNRKLICWDCIHAKREYKTLTGDVVPMDPLGKTPLDEHPCVCCKKMCRGFLWEYGRMRFECQTCFEILTA